jgi:hypothetical protein
MFQANPFARACGGPSQLYRIFKKGKSTVSKQVVKRYRNMGAFLTALDGDGFTV